MDISPEYNLAMMGKEQIYLSKTTGYTPLFSYFFYLFSLFNPQIYAFLFFYVIR